MYKRVDHDWEGDGRPGRQVVEIVCQQHHAGVVVHVQEAYLTALVAQQHEHGVQQFGHLQQPVEQGGGLDALVPLLAVEPVTVQ